MKFFFYYTTDIYILYFMYYLKLRTTKDYDCKRRHLTHYFTGFRPQQQSDNRDTDWSIRTTEPDQIYVAAATEEIPCSF